MMYSQAIQIEDAVYTIMTVANRSILTDNNYSYVKGVSGE